MLTIAEQCFLWSAGATLAASLAALLYLRRPLRQMLAAQFGAEERIRFWAAYAHLLLLLLPLFFVGLGRSMVDRRESELFIVVQYLLWAMGGLVTALLLLAMVLTSLPRLPRTLAPSQPEPPGRLPERPRHSLN